MKKLMIFMATALCIFGLTGCGEAKELTQYEQTKVENAEFISTNLILPLLDGLCSGESGIIEEVKGYTMEEVSFMGENMVNYYGSYFGVSDYKVDGYGFYNALTSFDAAATTIGNIVDYGQAECKIDGEQIIVTVPVVCENGKATAEVIVTNDSFCNFKSATINQELTMGEKMSKAGLNTVIGIGTVFLVLILIFLLISLFGFIPKIQKAIADSKAAKLADKNAAVNGIENAVNQIIENEVAEEETDDTELIAVIAAAIAAFEGSAGADGYVVRSIRRRR